MQILRSREGSTCVGQSFDLQHLPQQVRGRTAGNLHDTQTITLEYIGHARISLNQAVGLPPLLIITHVVMHSVARHWTMSEMNWSSVCGQRTRTMLWSHRRNAWRYKTKTKARAGISYGKFFLLFSGRPTARTFFVFSAVGIPLAQRFLFFQRSAYRSH